jgi:signal transduction histidine kinase
MKNIEKMTKSQLITELAAARRQLVKLETLTKKHKKIEAQQAQLIGELDAFAHTVAHDLRTPLSVIIGFAGTLAEDYDGLSPQERRYVTHTIIQASRRMSKIIAELLLLAEIRDREVVVTPLDMAAIVAEVRESLAPMITEYQAEVVLPAAWPTALGYAPWIEEVWMNYLSNGLKYGGQPPHLELGANIHENGMIRFWIRDNGKGLTPDRQTRLFTPFTQLSQVRAKGHGLGLSIVYRIICKKLGGQVGVESTGLPGQGSTFYFTLPSANGLGNDPVDRDIIKRLR